MLKHLHLRNFKSFESLDLELGPFSVFVGANAAGKSNILQAFKFIHDISIHGLQNAVAIQSGFKFLRNAQCGPNGQLVVEALVESSEQFFLPLINNKEKQSKGFTICSATEMHHKLTLASDGDSFKIASDEIECKFTAEPREGGRKIPGSFKASHIDERVRISFEFASAAISVDESLISRLSEGHIKLGGQVSLAFSAQPFFLVSIPNPSQVSPDLDIAYYDFDPRLSKQAVRISGSSDLEESADNLAVVIQSILADPKRRDRLVERIRDLLPHVRSVDLEHFSDSSVLMSMREQYLSDYVFPASLISNGTVSVIAILVAVLFQKSRIVIMEEPERNIHPYLIERVLNTTKEASLQKQILISTHSPVVLDNCDLDSLFLVRRDESGISRVTKPKDSQIVASFLAEDFGIGRLYETKLLEM